MLNSTFHIPALGRVRAADPHDAGTVSANRAALARVFANCAAAKDVYDLVSEAARCVSWASVQQTATRTIAPSRNSHIETA